ncbi:MAG: DUF1858 domain-containing protein [Butyrivibrio sp.]|nr:DUF1858 domain-containing protein [Butyrivibrio sp.]
MLKDLFFGDEEVENTENNVATQENAEAENEAADTGLITQDMLMGDIIMKHPLAAQFLMECGMGCIYCPSSQMESLAEACVVHGIDGEEITIALNDYLARHEQ